MVVIIVGGQHHVVIIVVVVVVVVVLPRSLMMPFGKARVSTLPSSASSASASVTIPESQGVEIENNPIEKSSETFRM